MRLILEIGSIALLVVLGLIRPEPYRDLARQIFPWAQIAPSRLANLKGGVVEGTSEDGAPAESRAPSQQQRTWTPMNTTLEPRGGKSR
jgi:hypothetical protein